MSEAASGKLIMYSMEFCPTCDKARRTLAAEGADFEELLVDDNEDWQNLVFLKTGQTTVPVFVHPDGRWEVGFRGEFG